jgi:site-specific DNA-methyltransferase (adenine-specific)
MGAIELDHVYCMDAIEYMKGIMDGTIDLIVTDPPYRVTQKGCHGTMGGYWSHEKANNGKIFDHNDIDIEEYLPEFYRILKHDAHCYIMSNNLNLPHFFDVIGKSKFHFVKLLVWNKQSKICGRYYMGQVEHIFMLRKGKDKPINNCSQSDLLSFSNFNREKDKNGNNLHDSMKPIPLMQCMIENSTQEGELVLDPFMGSGTTALACIRSKRHYIGCEIDQKYYKVALDRIEKEKNTLTLF